MASGTGQQPAALVGLAVLPDHRLCRRLHASITTCFGRAISWPPIYDKEVQRGEQIKSAAMAKFEATLDQLEPSQDAVIAGKGQQTFSDLVRAVPSRRRRRTGRAEPVRRLLDPRLQFRGQRARPLSTACPKRACSPGKTCSSRNEIHAVASYIYTCAAPIRRIPNRRKTGAGRTAEAETSLSMKRHAADDRPPEMHDELAQPTAETDGHARRQEVNWDDFRDHLATADKEGAGRWLYPKKAEGPLLSRADLGELAAAGDHVRRAVHRSTATRSYDQHRGAASSPSSARSSGRRTGDLRHRHAAFPDRASSSSPPPSAGSGADGPVRRRC